MLLCVLCERIEICFVVAVFALFEMLRQAILDDEVQVKTQDGVAFCQWRQLREDHVDERATDAKLALDSKKVSGQQPDGDAL